MTVYEGSELRLTFDGWEVFIPGHDPIPVHADYAYELSGYDQAVLDATRKLCGELRFKAKKHAATAEILSDLRAGLRRAAQIKEQRAEAAT